MMGGNHKFSISPEEYIFAAIAIYLDILNLFLHILKLVAAARKNWTFLNFFLHFLKLVAAAMNNRTILNFFLHILKIVAVARKTWNWVLKWWGETLFWVCIMYSVNVCTKGRTANKIKLKSNYKEQREEYDVKMWYGP